MQCSSLWYCQSFQRYCQNSEVTLLLPKREARWSYLDQTDLGLLQKCFVLWHVTSLQAMWPAVLRPKSLSKSLNFLRTCTIEGVWAVTMLPSKLAMIPSELLMLPSELTMVPSELPMLLLDICPWAMLSASLYLLMISLAASVFQLLIPIPTWQHHSLLLQQVSVAWPTCLLS